MECSVHGCTVHISRHLKEVLTLDTDERLQVISNYNVSYRIVGYNHEELIIMRGSILQY